MDTKALFQLRQLNYLCWELLEWDMLLFDPLRQRVLNLYEDTIKHLPEDEVENATEFLKSMREYEPGQI